MDRGATASAAAAEPGDPVANRDRWIDPRFTLPRHLAKVLGTAAAIAGVGGWMARDADPWAWALLPVFWGIANIFEACVHRFPMHRPLVPRALYLAHTKAHHFAYDGDAQEIRHSRDLNLVMMPWFTLALMFVMASPIIAVIVVAGGWALGGVFVVSAVAYFLGYEVIHTLHHLPATGLRRTWLGGGWPGRLVFWLRAYHHHHHQHRNMRHTNFNVTLPLGDWLLGTYNRR